MTAHKHSAKAQEMIESLLPEMTEIVEGINNPKSMMPSTQFNYAGYMSTLSALVPDGDRTMLYIIAESLRQAGGDKRGIASALRIITG